MLTEEQCKLLSAAIDGELSQSEDETLRHLLSTSAEAMNAYSTLLQQSQWIQSLAKLNHEVADFASPVAALIHSKTTTSSSRKLDTSSRNSVAYILAALVFLAITAGSFWLNYHDKSAHQSSITELANQRPELSKNKDRLVNQGTSSKFLTDDSSDHETSPVISPGTMLEVGQLASAKKDPPFSEHLPEPRPAANANPTAHGALPLQTIDELNYIELNLPEVVSWERFTNMTSESSFGRLASGGQALRFDLFTPEPAKFVTTLQNALNKCSIQLKIEPLTQERMKAHIPVSYVTYLQFENTREFNLFCESLSGLLPKAASHSTVLHYLRCAANDAKELKELYGQTFGVDQLNLEQATIKLPAATIDELTAQLNTAPKHALLLTYLPAPLRASQAALPATKTFSNLQQNLGKQQIGLMLVIRPNL